MKRWIAVFVASMACGCDQKTPAVSPVLPATPHAGATQPATPPLPASPSYADRTRPMIDALLRIKSDVELNVSPDAMATRYSDALVEFIRWQAECSPAEKSKPSYKSIVDAMDKYKAIISSRRQYSDMLNMSDRASRSGSTATASVFLQSADEAWQKANATTRPAADKVSEAVSSIAQGR